MQINRVWIFVVLLLGAVGALYGQFLWNPIVFDDLYPFMLDNEGNQPVSNFHFSWLELRSLPNATLAWTKAWFGLDLIYFRLGNLLLHALIGVTLFFFLRRLYRQTFAISIAEADKQPWLAGAFIAALLFVVHPVAVYGAGYLIQRTIVVATLFSLLALIAYMKGLEENRWPGLWASVAFYLLAVLSKEHAIMLPAVMLSLTIVVAGTGKSLFQRLWPIYLACFMVAMFVLSQKMEVIGTAYEIDAPKMLEHAVEQSDGRNHNHLLSILTQCKLFFKYLGLWLLPNPGWMSVDMRVPFAGSLFSLYLIAVLGFLAYGGIAIRMLFKRGSHGLVGLAMLFPWLLFFTELSTTRIQESFVLYRSYLWMPGIFIAFPLLMMQIKPRIAIISGVLLAALLAMLAAERLTTFSHPLLLWDDAEKLVRDKRNLPGVDRIYGNRAKHFGDVKRYPDAIADYQTALNLRPNFAHYYQGMGIAYLNMGEYSKARDSFLKANELEPGDVKSFYGRGIANDGLGKKAAALADFERSCELGWKSGCSKAQQLKGENASALRVPQRSP